MSAPCQDHEAYLFTSTPAVAARDQPATEMNDLWHLFNSLKGLVTSLCGADIGRRVTTARGTLSLSPRLRLSGTSVHYNVTADRDSSARKLTTRACSQAPITTLPPIGTPIPTTRFTIMNHTQNHINLSSGPEWAARCTGPAAAGDSDPPAGHAPAARSVSACTRPPSCSSAR